MQTVEYSWHEGGYTLRVTASVTAPLGKAAPVPQHILKALSDLADRIAYSAWGWDREPAADDLR